MTRLTEAVFWRKSQKSLPVSQHMTHCSEAVLLTKLARQWWRLRVVLELSSRTLNNTHPIDRSKFSDFLGGQILMAHIFRERDFCLCVSLFLYMKSEKKWLRLYCFFFYFNVYHWTISMFLLLMIQESFLWNYESFQLLKQIPKSKLLIMCLVPRS